MFGLRVKNAQGQVTLDISDRAGLLLGSFVIPKAGQPNATGYINIPELDGTNGTPFWFIAQNEGSVWDGGTRDFPFISNSGGVLSWANTTSLEYTVLFGVF